MVYKIIAEHQFYFLSSFHSLFQFLQEEHLRERSCSVSVQCMLEDVFRMAIMSAFPELESPAVMVTPSSKMADYQCNSAMSLAQV